MPENVGELVLKLIVSVMKANNVITRLMIS